MKNKLIPLLALLPLLVTGCDGSSESVQETPDFEIQGAKMFFTSDIDRQNIIEKGEDDKYHFEIEQHVYACLEFKFKKNYDMQDQQLDVEIAFRNAKCYSCKDYVGGNNDDAPNGQEKDFFEGGEFVKGWIIPFAIPVNSNNLIPAKYMFEIAGNRPKDETGISVTFTNHNPNKSKVFVNGESTNMLVTNLQFQERQ